ncbi:MAG TPA: thioredoxin family protein [Oligoflexus sp.]|uniref:thioredoxin family protein n=1 Tax=Oligoflexus sp. TaxID=1971216 RepID=UPI002D3215BE|nr:thioredoxin family protein [Oligoflexus sp.]HYX39515.1 thioredoxin family protein [Oligoflexus sp.]
MKLTQIAPIILPIGLLFNACATTPKADSEGKDKEKKEHVLQGQPQPDVWFQGRPEQAFAQAKADNKLLFVYWGAAWCPPCNELKSEVFSKPRFAELMKNFIPVYLDGDTDQAQVWGERLSASGYPTVLVLTPDGRELYRLSTSLNEDEFHAAVQPVLKNNQNFAEAFSRLENRDAKDDDWKVLAYTSWDQLPEGRYTVDRLVNAAKRAADKCPATMPKEKAIFAANLLNLAALNKDNKESANSLADIKMEAKRYLDAIFASKESVQGARGFINYNAKQTAVFLYGKPAGKGYEDLKKRWLKAAGDIAANPANSVDTRLAAWNPAIEFHKLEAPNGPVPAKLKADVQAAATQADKNAGTAFERHAVISSAAYMLRQVGDFSGARQLLETEAAKTDTPWYYYSSLASLEQELKNEKAAQTWAAKARESVVGRASKIQWITSDIVLNAKIKNADQKAYMLNLTREYYDVATSLNDGFSGRNWARAKKVSESLKDWQKDPAFTALFSSYEAKCSGLEKESQKNCQQHFAGLKN